MDILKVAIFGIAGVLLAIPLKRERGEYSVFLSAAVCVCIFFYILTKAETVLDFAGQIQEKLPIDSQYLVLVLKMIGITYVAEFAGNICKDAGYAAIGDEIGIFARLSILAVSVPVLSVFLETLWELG